GVAIRRPSGKTGATRAGAPARSQPTNTASSVLTAACSTMTSTFGAASRSSVRAPGPSISGRVRVESAADTGAASEAAVALISATHRLLTPEGHAGAGGARDQAILVRDHVALDETDRAAALHHVAGGHQRPGPHRLEEVDLELQ